MSSTKIGISERGKKLREFRELRALTQAQVAAEVGCTGGNISDIELGRSKGSNALIRAIERRFSINLTEISAPIYKEGDKDAGAIIEAAADYGDSTRARVIKRIKRLPPERSEKLIDAISKMLDVFEDNINI